MWKNALYIWGNWPQEHCLYVLRWLLSHILFRLLTPWCLSLPVSSPPLAVPTVSSEHRVMWSVSVDPKALTSHPWPREVTDGPCLARPRRLPPPSWSSTSVSEQCVVFQLNAPTASWPPPNTTHRLGHASGTPLICVYSVLYWVVFLLFYLSEGDEIAFQVEYRY